MQNVVFFLNPQPNHKKNFSTMLTHAEFKNRIRSHEKPQNLDKT